MTESLRQKRIASLVKEELSRLLLQEFQDQASGLLTVTRVEMTGDLRTAHIYLSVFGYPAGERIIKELNRRQGYLRKCVASRVKLKYNPSLIFSLDDTAEYQEKIDRIIKTLKKERNEK